MSVHQKFFLLLGGTYRLICRVPLVGEPAVRGFCRALGFMGNRVPGGMKWRGSISELKEDLERVFERLDIDFETMDHDEESIELILSSCPYGYRRPEHALACDAAMDMDRTMFGNCGCDLTIENRLPHGDPVCTVIIRRKD
jgi:predicted ArsR family transcriptional regulator